MPKFYDIDQRSDEWFNLRAGKITGSQLSKIMSGETTQGFKDIINRLASERLHGMRLETDTFISADMQRGIDLEPIAIEMFECETLIEIKNGGFWEYSDSIGDSPDGNFDGGTLEVKCVKYNTIEKYHIENRIPPEYRYQCQHHLLCSGSNYGYFMAYNELYKPFIIGYNLDNEVIDKMLERFELCEKLISERIEQIKWFKA
jgi:hypothetical protein